MRSDAIIQHDDGTPTGSRSTSFFIRGILGPDAWSMLMRCLRRRGERFSVAASLVGHPGDGWRFRPGCSIGRPARPGVLAPLPNVDIAVLTALATLLQDVTSVSGAPSQLRDSSAALGSHEANRGDVHAAPAYRSPSSSEQCTSVRSVLLTPYCAAQTRQWRAWPPETRHTLTKLITRLIFGHADGDLVNRRGIPT